MIHVSPAGDGMCITGSGAEGATSGYAGENPPQVPPGDEIISRPG
jgi:hypothetical protein